MKFAVWVFVAGFAFVLALIAAVNLVMYIFGAVLTPVFVQ